MAEAAPQPSNLDALIERLVAGDAGALARCITLVEDRELGAIVRQRIRPLTGRAIVVGFTGPPGVGKSTLVDAYIGRLRRAGQSVAVAAVDPSSPLSGGAVLGDRIRMHRHTSDPGVFIRSIASRGHLGGTSENIGWTIDCMDAAGRDVVIIETVGTGQSEVDVAEIADTCVVVNAPGLGDDVQAIKAGDRGIDDLCGAIERSEQKSPEEKQGLRARRTQRLIAQTAAALTRRMVLEYPPDQAAVLVDSVLRGECNLEEAAMRVLRELLGEQNQQID